MEELGNDQELFNAINKTLPLTAPSAAVNFENLEDVCQLIEDATSRDDILLIVEAMTI